MQSNINDIKNTPRHLCLLLFLSGWIATFGGVVFTMSQEESFAPSHQEIWADISGWEGKYKVSNYGRVQSIERKDPLDHPVLGRYLQLENASGYRRVSFCEEGIVTRYLVHRLVATAFIPNPENKPCVNHKDGDRSNNHVWNLEWATHSENSQHAIDTGLSNPVKGLTGILNAKSKPVVQMDEAGVVIKIWESANLAGLTLKIRPRSIGRVCYGEKIRTGGYKWKFLNQKS